VTDGGVGAESAWVAPPPFTTLDRLGWTALAPRASTVPVRRSADSPITDDEWAAVYVPLAHVVGVHLDARTTRPLMVGLAGGVASGKSACADALADLLAARAGHPHVAVVSTDGFLLSNAVLGERGLAARKGFPESYDHDLVADVLGRIALGHEGVEVPRYSHRTYDIDDRPVVLGRPDVVIVEGINALTPVVSDFCSLLVYLDAAEADLRAWFVARFQALTAEAAGDPGSFFAAWVGAGPDEVHGLAVTVWEHVNRVNLDEHILPTRWRADIVLRKGPDHALTHAAVRDR
jgi:type I pantothenate kinase